MKASTVFTGLFLIGGWAVAGWLFLRPAPALPSNDTPAPVVDKIEREVPVSPSVTSGESPISGLFQSWSSDPLLQGALIGFCVLDETGEVVYASPLAESALCPASALKTMTTAAALETLGPDFTFETRVAATSVSDAAGVVNGDLVLVGGGDPTLSSEDLATLADAVAKSGIKRITGRVLADVSVFSQPPVSDHWNWGDVGNAYGAGAYGLNVDHNRLAVLWKPAAEPGAPASLLDISPVVSGTDRVNRVMTGPAGGGDGVTVYSEPLGRRITLTGSVPAGVDDFTVGGAIPDPPALAVELLEKRLKSSGVIVGNKVLPSQAIRLDLATHRSAPLPQIIDHLHRVSDNLESQCLFYMMGERKGLAPAVALKQHWEGRGVEFSGLRLIDGSGLARAGMIRPLDLARINHLARRGVHGERFRQSLSVYLDGAVRSKLGAMSGVKTDVGFLTTSDGRELTYCLMANGLDTAVNFWPLREKLLRAVR